MIIIFALIMTKVVLWKMRIVITFDYICICSQVRNFAVNHTMDNVLIEYQAAMKVRLMYLCIHTLVSVNIVHIYPIR